MKYHIGQKVKFEALEGYIIGINIDSLEELDVAFESREWVSYTIRVYRKFYINGYTDFCRSEGEFAACD